MSCGARSSAATPRRCGSASHRSATARRCTPRRATATSPPSMRRRARSAGAPKLELPLAAGPGYGEELVVVGSTDGMVTTLSAADGAVRWSRNLGAEILARPLVIGGRIFVRTVDGHLRALDVSSGNEAWSLQREVPRLSLRGNSTPVIAGNNIIVAFDDGKVVASDLGDGESGVGDDDHAPARPHGDRASRRHRRGPAPRRQRAVRRGLSESHREARRRVGTGAVELRGVERTSRRASTGCASISPTTRARSSRSIARRARRCGARPYCGCARVTGPTPHGNADRRRRLRGLSCTGSPGTTGS